MNPEASGTTPIVEDDSALLVVDLQYDFCPGGALGVPEGDTVIPVLNRWINAYVQANRPVAYTQDWHPEGHISFQEQGGPWPPHCIQGSKGARFHSELKLEGSIFRKGYEKDKEAYSGFDGHLLVADRGIDSKQDLASWLRARDVDRLFVGGLATDYCVHASVLDALDAGFQVTLISDAHRGVNVEPGDVQRALDEMTAKGAEVIP